MWPSLQWKILQTWPTLKEHFDFFSLDSISVRHNYIPFQKVVIWSIKQFHCLVEKEICSFVCEENDLFILMIAADHWQIARSLCWFTLQRKLWIQLGSNQREWLSPMLTQHSFQYVQHKRDLWNCKSTLKNQKKNKQKPVHLTTQTQQWIPTPTPTPPTQTITQTWTKSLIYTTVPYKWKGLLRTFIHIHEHSRNYYHKQIHFKLIRKWELCEQWTIKFE